MRTARQRRGILTPVNLQEHYVDLGEHSVKILIDPSVSDRVSSVDVRIRNADGSPIRSSFRRWGTKLNLSFSIDESTPDGVAMIDVTLEGFPNPDPRDPCPGIRIERLSFWIIK